MTTNALCFLDMDGVLADFVGGVCKAHNRPDPYDDPKSYGIWDMEILWNLSIEDFWAPTNVDGFWRNLAKTPEADALVEMAFTKFGPKNVAVLTSPSSDYRCIPEKKAWMKEHYPELAPNMLFGSAKRFLAGPGRFLIDDRDKNIDSFVDAGGIGIVMPHLWNVGHSILNPLAYVEHQLDAWMRIIGINNTCCGGCK